MDLRSVLLWGWLAVRLSRSVLGQVPMESSVTLSLSYAPRAAAKASVKTLSSAELIREMGLAGGEIVCVVDASDTSAPWIFKHVLPAVHGGGGKVETDLSERIGLEVLGYSEVGGYKAPSLIAPKRSVTLGKVTRTQTIRISVEPRDGMFFEFWGSQVVGYSVVQRAGTTQGVWVPSSMSFTAAGVSGTGLEGESLSWASMKGTMGAFKVLAPFGLDGTNRGLVSIAGGTLPAGSGVSGKSVNDFWIGRYEVMWAEWKWIREWARGHGYDLAGVGAGSADDHPVRNVNWYDAVKWCNARSEREGLTPVYRDERGVYRTGEFGFASSVISESADANGYRLPREREWEWAARGGAKSKGYVYSGGNDLGAVGWFWANSNGNNVAIYGGRGTWPVGRKGANELGLYDLSGNVGEWVWELNENTFGRRFRGGSWSYGAESTEVSRWNDDDDPSFRDDSRGFRVVRSLVGGEVIP
jgi:sulfatase modifying factor 1